MQNDDLFPKENENREIKRTDNNPPESLPEQLASAAEIKIIIKNDVEEATKKALEQLDVVSRVPAEILNEEIYQRIITLATRVKKVSDDSEKIRKKHKDPYLKATKEIDDAFTLTIETEEGDKRVLKKELETAHQKLKTMLSAYDTKKYEEEQRAIKKEREELAEKMKQDGISVETTAEVAIATTVKSAHGGQSVRKVVTDWEVEDEKLLPRSVLSIDPAKVKKLLDEGVTEIPGIKITKKVETHAKR
jgi:hypothetical protein